jgi:hypothetical protein
MAPKPMEASTTTTAPPKPIDYASLTQEQLGKLPKAEQEKYFVWLASQGNATQSTTGLPSTYVLPPRKWTDSAGVVKTYTGDQLLNTKTGAERAMYSINQDPTAIIGDYLTKSGPQGLLKFLRSLKSLGFYEGANVGNGNSSADIGAVSSFLRYSNQQGLEMTSALTLARQDTSGMFSSTSGMGSPNVTSPTDLKSVFQSVAMSTLGRGLSESQADGMVQSYQQLERSAAYGSTSAPNMQTYANENLRTKFKGEAQDFQAMNVADSMLDIIKGS